VQTLNIRNKGTSQVDITVQHYDGSITAQLFKATLWAGYHLSYIDGEGWELTDQYGNVQQAASVRAAFIQEYNAVTDFNFVGDLVTVFDGAMNSGSPTLTCATSAPFAATDVGKRITVARAGASNAQLTTSIIGFTSPSVVTLGASAGSTVTNSGVSFGTDNTAAITAMQNAINNAAFPGARIVFPRSATNAYGFPTQVTFNKAVQIEGMGGGHTVDTGDYTRIGGTRLAWWGTSLDGGSLFKPFFEFSPTGVQSLKRVSMRHIWLDCRNGDQNESIIGLKLASCHAFILHDFFIMDAAGIGIWTDIDSDPTEAKDTTRFLISQYCSRQLDNPVGAVTTPITTSSAVALTTTPQSLTVAANSLPASGYVWIETNLGYPVLVSYTGGGGTTTLTGCTICAEDVINAPATVNGSNVVQAVPGNGTCLKFSGGTGANTCCGTILQAQLSHGTTWGPAAIEIYNSDSVEYLSIYINGGSNTSDGAINRIRKPGVRLNGSNTSATLAARNNTFRGGSAGAGGMSAMGVLNTGTRLTAMSGPNYWDLYQMGNGEALPIVEGNTYFDWQPNGGIRTGPRGSSSVADQAIPAATLTQILGSLISVPPQGFQVGTVFRWRFNMTKTAGGTAASVFHIRIGTAGTTADGIVATFTTGLGTAAIDTAVVEVTMTIRTLGGAATVTANLMINHNLAATGWLVIPTACINGTMAAFNSTTAQQFISMTITSGASVVPTVQSCVAECINPANP